MKNAIAIAVLFFLAAACQQEHSSEAYKNVQDEMMMEAPGSPESDMARAESLESGEGQPGGRGDLPPAVEPKIIRNANVVISVEDYAKGRAALARLTERTQATIAHEGEQRSAYRIENNLTIRLAPEKLDSFILGLEQLALHVDSKNVDSRDVTREFVDIESRLSVKRGALERYREILRSAKTVTDILAVEQQLRAIIEEIESAEGQLRYLRDQVQYSTVNLTMYQEFDRPDVARPAFWNRIGRGFGEGWHTFLDIIVGLVHIWPIALIVIGAGWWLVRRMRRRRS